MEYTCSVCKKEIQGGLVRFTEHTEKHIIELVKHDHPEWVEADGLCPACAQYYHHEIEGSVFKDAPCALRARKVKNFWERLTRLFRR